MSAYATESITIDATAGGVGFTTATLNISEDNKTSGVGPSRPESAVFVIETAEIRYTLDGTAPTTTIGTLGTIGDIVTINGEKNMRNFRAIRTGGSSGVIQPIYFTGER